MTTRTLGKNLLALATSALILTGCASTSEIEAAKSAADQAMAAANRAASRAEAAEAKADRAMRMAQEAQQCCSDNSEKINRMLERNMSK